jgi:hypothetical protein
MADILLLLIFSIIYKAREFININESFYQIIYKSVETWSIKHSILTKIANNN